MALHDATSGFHDIKPLAPFSPINFTFWTLLVATLLGLLLLYYFYRRAKSRPIPTLLPPAPDAEALAQLDALEKRRRAGTVALREFSGSLSVILRTFLERDLGFAAVEQTSAEVVNSFPRFLQKRVGNRFITKQEQLHKELGSLLTFLDYLCFSNSSEQRYFCDSSELTNQSAAIRQLILSCAQLSQDADKELANSTTLTSDSTATAP